MAQESGCVVTRRVPWASRIDPALGARVRATVIGLQQATDPSFTAGRFTEQALLAWCQRMEAEYNDGQPWPQDPANQLRRGARITQ